MKVAVLVRTRIWGGLETHLVGLLAATAARGHEPMLVCVGDETRMLFARHCPDLSAEVVTIPDHGSRGWAWHREFRRLGVDACVFEKGTLHTGSLAMEVGLRLACPAFATIEQLEPPVLAEGGVRRRVNGIVPGIGLWRARARAAGWLRSLAPRRIICITEAVRGALATTYRFPDRKMVVVHNGVDVSRYRPAPALRSEARAQLGIPPGVFVFGSMCRLIHDKGVDVALQAFASSKVRSASSPCWYVVAGDGSERAALERLARDLHIADRVRFVGFLGDTARFYAAVDTFLVPSRIEAQGIVVLEAMASGCDLIASRVGGIPEMIPGDSVATLVRPDDHEAWANAMADAVVRSATDRGTRASAAADHVSKHFAADRQYAAVLSIVESLAGHPPRSGAR
ncbi:MAG: glycosyltransferase family 4 protein [Acidobacteria bacterium]|nr:glycosyltransferase family 4 protein [Acidobacteriota bacterium]